MSDLERPVGRDSVGPAVGTGGGVDDALCRPHETVYRDFRKLGDDGRGPVGADPQDAALRSGPGDEAAGAVRNQAPEESFGRVVHLLKASGKAEVAGSRYADAPRGAVGEVGASHLPPNGRDPGYRLLGRERIWC